MWMIRHAKLHLFRSLDADLRLYRAEQIQVAQQVLQNTGSLQKLCQVYIFEQFSRSVSVQQERLRRTWTERLGINARHIAAALTRVLVRIRRVAGFQVWSKTWVLHSKT